MVTIILAHDKNYGIGKNGKLPWRVKEDLAHFKKMTYGKDLIVGRKTAEELPPLKGRQVYVVSRSGLSIEGALELSTNPVIIGGAEIYHYCLDNGLVDEIIVTEIDGEYECDTFMRRDYLSGFSKSDVVHLGNSHFAIWYIKGSL